MFNLFRSICAYLGRPALVKLTITEQPYQLIAKLTGICIFVGVCGGMLSGMLVNTGLIPDPGPNVLDQDKLSRTSFFFAAVLLAPLLEEMIFRAQLRRFSGGIMFVSFTFGIILTAVLRTAWAFLASPLIFFILFIIYRFTLAGSVSRKFLFWQRLFPWHFHFTALCFALVHLSNYEKGISLLPLGVLYTLPQLAIGLVLGYARMNYGLKYSIVLHGLYNLSLSLLFLARLKS
jgi:membrane protease YdiL (CAAX protease family)